MGALGVLRSKSLYESRLGALDHLLVSYGRIPNLFSTNVIHHGFHMVLSMGFDDLQDSCFSNWTVILFFGLGLVGIPDHRSGLGHMSYLSLALLAQVKSNGRSSSSGVIAGTTS